MTIDTILKSRNVDGEIYLWDVKEYFGLHENPEKAEELRNLLNDLRI